MPLLPPPTPLAHKAGLPSTRSSNPRLSFAPYGPTGAGGAVTDGEAGGAVGAGMLLEEPLHADAKTSARNKKRTRGALHRPRRDCTPLATQFVGFCFSVVF